MNCPTCTDFAVLKTVVERMEPQLPWLTATINVGLVWHLSVAHGLSYQDLGQANMDSPDMPDAAVPPPAPPDEP
jgi:hypothetical protein